MPDENVTNQPTEQLLVSASVPIRPRDSRCRYWAKILRADQPLAIPEAMRGANDIPAPYLSRGEEELFLGDVFFEGEEAHHRHARGWIYNCATVSINGSLIWLSYDSEMKKLMKSRGLPPELLKGSGDIAAMMRVAHGLRLGIVQIGKADLRTAGDNVVPLLAASA